MDNLEKGDSKTGTGQPDKSSSESSNNGATPAFSEEQVRQILSSPDVKSIIEEIAEAKATSAAQSMGDKKGYQIQRQVDEVLKEYRTLLEEGWSEKQAERLMRMKAPPEETKEESPKPKDEPKRDLNFKSVFEVAGIDPASGTAVKLAKESGGDPAKLLSLVLEASKSSGEKEASPAGLVGEPGSTGVVNSIAEVEDHETLLTMAFRKKS